MFRSILPLFLAISCSYITFISALSIPSMNIKGSFQAPSLLQDLTGFGSPRQTIRPASGSSECTNGGSMYCCPSFIQSGVDGPCQDPLKVDLVQQCRKQQPHGMVCCINEASADWYCWSV